MDNDQITPAPPHRKTSLPTFDRSIPVEITALPASTRSSFTRVENITRPGTAAGDNDLRDAAAVVVPDGVGDGHGGSDEGDRSSDARAAAPEDEQEEGENIAEGGDDGNRNRRGGGEEAAPATESVPQVPQTLLQFLLVSGRRRSMAFDPETTVGRVKELVWNSWPNDWQDERPPAPSFLRVLYLGKILQDEDTLAQLKFPSYTPPETATPTIVHLSIRSSMPREDTSLKKKRRMSRSGVDANPAGTDQSQNEQGGGCCCIIC
ncbi:ubiquitin-related domain-containing protein [Russula dissimulans]|nr:ubiquitin-related domain-containing protein [Russula dissimulans]